jgi:hypothetical protein
MQIQLTKNTHGPTLTGARDGRSGGGNDAAVVVEDRVGAAVPNSACGAAYPLD